VTTRLQPGKLVIEGEDPIGCLVDPSGCSIARTGHDMPEVTLALVLEASLVSSKLSVRGLAALLVRTSPEPPAPRIGLRSPVIDVSGAICSSVRVAFTEFTSRGEPIRAEIRMTVSEQPAVKGSARMLAGRGIYIVAPGDSLPSIAHAVYGDATRWREIAEASGIDDPVALRQGRTLMLPPPSSEARR
jgi:hypothetical protein